MEKLDPKGIENILALTPLQEGMHFHYLQDPRSGLYFEQLSLEISGEFDGQVFEKAWNTVVKTNEMLRTVFRWEKVEKPSQIILKEHKCNVVFYDLSGKDSGQKKTALEEIKTIDRDEGFDLTQVCFRVILCKMDKTEYEMIISNHHILYDGWSNGIILKEFFNAYQALCQGEQTLYLPAKPSFKEYIKWLQSQDKNKQELFWRDYLAGFETPTELPIKRRMEETGGAGEYSIILADDIKEKLDVVVKNNRVTLASVFYSSWGILLQKYCGSEDVIFGTTVSGRSGGIKGIEDMVGLFINTIPLRTQTAPDEKIIDVVIETDQRLREREAFESTPLVDIQSYSPLESGGSLFDTIVVIENYPLDDVVHLDVARNVSTKNPNVSTVHSVHSYSMAETTHYDLTVGIIPSNEIEIKFSFKQELFEKGAIENLTEHFKGIIQNMIENPETALSQLEIISSEEKNRLLYEFNNTAAAYPKDKTIHQLFEEQVEKSPDRIAVIGSTAVETLRATSLQITYRQLNEQSNRLAGLLIEKGVLADTIVGIKMERCVEMIIGILGILKSGGAYLPIDPDYPQERVNYMLKDSATKLLVTTNDKEGQKVRSWDGEKNLEIIFLDSFSLSSFLTSYLPNFLTSHPYNLAYIIYTSGTTGKPKGVMIEHRNVLRLVKHCNYVHFSPRDRLLLTGATAFDITTFEIWGPLLNGVTLTLMYKNFILNTDRLKEILVNHNISVLHLIPQIFNQLAGLDIEIFAGLRYFLVGGDFVNPVYINKLRQRHRNLKILHMYGPTENTTFSTAFLVDKEYKERIPIGRPIANSTAYIVDKKGNLQPIQIAGELWVGGCGISRGYLNNPVLTAEKFVDLFINDRLYKTGDLARWLPDGNIEFLGRIDNQVKIRGFRIELGEIETKLARHADISDAVVSVKEDENGNKNLHAYIVPIETKPGHKLTASHLREYLSRELPDYMIPAYFVYLEKIPVTVNGKIDYKSLSNLQEIVVGSNMNNIPPQTPVEKKLAETWEKVLGRSNVGINENFFEAGGDSIKAIQVMSRMNRSGYKIQMKDLFQYPVISELAPHVKKSKRIPDQSVITGTIPLTPIQVMFFRQSLIGYNNFKDYNHFYHFNQAVMFYSKAGIDKEITRNVFTKIQEHHDALRMTYQINMETGEVFQIDHGLDYPLSLEEYDLRNRGTDFTEELQTKANEIQADISLEKGPLMKLGLFHLDDGDRLLIVIHHLVIDGISWRILFEDIETLYSHYKRREQPALALKTDSFKLWSEKLSAYANSKTLLKGKIYWQKIGSIETHPISKDFESADNYIKDSRNVSFSLGEEETERLLTKVNRAFSTDINDILLTALGIGIKWTFGHEHVLIALESHGREDILDDIDVSRTVGWFTAVYPVLMDISYADNRGRQIIEIKETLRKIPGKGIGYGILKYLTNEENKKDIGFSLKPQISFNYLGQFDTDVKQISSFEIAGESPGNTQDLNNQREYLLDINAMIASNRLTMTISYNETHFKPETIATLAEKFESELTNIIRFCCARENIERTPSDFTYKDLPIEHIARLMKEYPDLEDLYALTPMQEGMLFHALADDKSYSYFEQVSYLLQVELDIRLVEKSLNELLKRHAILRTAFVYHDIEHPVQVVLKERAIDFYFEDINKIRGVAEKENYIKEFKAKDRERSFKLSKDVLMRVMILRMDNAEYEFIWSCHHILMDGWCVGILNSEFFEIYNSYLENRPYQLPEVKPYRTYIQWLEKKDKEESARYWDNYLDSFEEQTGVPKTKINQNDSRYKNESVSIVLSREKIAGLNKMAAGNHLTLNTVTQAVWGYLLGRYNDKDDVVFGAVVSGRPHELEGVESMMGLFINTIPVRIRFEGAMKLKTLFRKIQEEALASEPHQYHALAEIQSSSTLKQNLIDHLFIFENYPIAEQIEGYGNEKNKRDALPFKLTNVDVFEQSNYDFNIVLVGTDELRITFQYNGNVYDSNYIERIAKHFNLIVDQVIENQELEIRELTYLPEEEKNRLLYDFNDTDAEYPKEKTIHQLFAEQALKIPDRIALVGAGEAEEKTRRREEEKNGGVETLRATSLQYQYQMSYRQLNEQSDRLAGLLIEKGVLPDTIVGIMMERSVEMIVGILGILKSGGAYLPIDPEYPRERIEYMLKDSNAKILINKSEIRNPKSRVQKNPNEKNPNDQNKSQPFGAAFVLNFEHLNLSSLKGCPHRGLHHSSHLAYLIYTSGSTGRPKGVLIEHQGIINLVYYHQEVFKTKHISRMSQVSSQSFDAMASEIWPCLSRGSVLLIAPNEIRMDPARMKEWLLLNQITASFQPIALAMHLLDEEWPETGVALKILWAAGDRLTRFPRHAYPFSLNNLYGPTEDTVWTTWKEVPVSQNTEAFPSIGRPIANHRIYILGKNSELQAIGIVGELCISSVGTARGYLNCPGSTAEKFIPNPFIHGDRLYKTGDQARWLPDGNIEFIGRIDHQVKIRGYRIELGEIEKCLLKVRGVKETVVLGREETGGNKYLCAYIVSNREYGISELRESLSKELPDYMIPTYFVQLEKIPLTPNGKVDRKALPKPELKAGESYTAPRDEIETKLVELWLDILGRDVLTRSQLQTSIGIDDNFFELGGHSLKATNLAARIHKAFDVKVPLIEIFKMPRIRQLAEYIKGKRKEIHVPIETVEEKEYYLLSFAQRRLYILQQMNPGSIAYNMPALIPLPAEFDCRKLEETLKKLIKRHESLRTSFHMVDDTPVQKIHDKVEFKIDKSFAELQKRLPEEWRPPQALPGEEKLKELICPFDLSQAPLLRVWLMKIEENRHVLLVDMHHIISDGVSHEILVKDYQALYNEKEIPPLRFQYKDFSEWQNSGKEKENLKRQEEYWLEQFSGGAPVMDLPHDYPRLRVQGFEGGMIEFEMDIEKTRALKSLAMEENVTLYILMIAVSYVFLAKISDCEDIIVGTDVAGRRHTDLENIIGMFVNTLALRNYPRGDKSFKQFLQEVKKSTLAALENQEYPFEDLVDRLGVNRDAGRNPLFDVMFSFWNSPEAIEKKPGHDISELKVKPYELKYRTAKFDLMLFIIESAEHMVLSFEYCTQLFKETTIKKFVFYFNNIIRTILEKPGTDIWEIEIVSDEEEKQLLKAIRPEVTKEFQKNGDEPGKLIDKMEVDFDF